VLALERQCHGFFVASRTGSDSVPCDEQWLQSVTVRPTGTERSSGLNFVDDLTGLLRRFVLADVFLDQDAGDLPVVFPFHLAGTDFAPFGDRLRRLLRQSGVRISSYRSGSRNRTWM